MEFTDADLAYIRANYLTLDQLCTERVETPSEVRRRIDEGLLPRPSYVLDNGTEMFPSDYFRLADEAGASTGSGRTSRSGCARRAMTTSTGSGRGISAGSMRSAFRR
jgi:hypothetical protein